MKAELSHESREEEIAKEYIKKGYLFAAFYTISYFQRYTSEFVKARFPPSPN